MPANEQGVTVSKHRYQIIPRVLCFVTHGEDVLLLKGAPSKKIWPNKYNGLGGHLERREGPAAAARREIKEDAGLDVTDLRLRGTTVIDTGEAAGIGLYVFTAQAASRAVVASGEGGLEWVPIHRVQEFDLVEDLFTLLPHLFSLPPTAPPFSAVYYYDAADKLVMRFDE
ncbi:MAG: NUDIX domain-containing protein [Anaerolineales bacterium]|nr:NUDIX domain-containing protein [Anaerolineales bacterium]